MGIIIEYEGVKGIDKYIIILKSICLLYGISNDEIYEILKNKKCRYLLLLLMKNFQCFDKNIIMEQLKLKSDRTIISNMKKAEEKLLINKEFREDYFYLEEKIKKNFKKDKKTLEKGLLMWYDSIYELLLAPLVYLVG